MDVCDFCKQGISDYNGRIVCKKNYVYPSFQEYSYNMMNTMKDRPMNKSEVMRTDLGFIQKVFYGLILIFFSLLSLLFIR